MFKVLPSAASEEPVLHRTISHEILLVTLDMMREEVRHRHAMAHHERKLEFLRAFEDTDPYSD
jgi:hypothetical protein